MNLKTFFIIGFFLLFSNTIFSQNHLTNQHLFDTLSFMQDHYSKKVAEFELEPVKHGGIIFLGNSITEMGEWRKLLKDSSVLNRGIGGDITYGVLKRLPDVIHRKPAKLFVLIGINDIGKDIPEAVIADNYRKIIERIKSESPQTKIFIQSLLPLNPKYPGFPQHYDKYERVLNLNKLLKELAGQSGTAFVNLVPVFSNSKGLLDEQYTIDGLHLNEKGYQLWVNFLKQRGYL